MKIGKLIETRRNALNYTMDELASLVGVSKSTIKKWESGYISNMGRDKIAKLSAALHVSPLDFIFEDENEKSKHYSKPSLTPHEERLILAYRAQPALQAAVDKLLDIEEEASPSQIETA